MSYFKGYLVAGHRDNPNQWVDGIEYIGGELITLRELMSRLGSKAIPDLLTKIDISREHIIYLYGCRFYSKKLVK